MNLRNKILPFVFLSLLFFSGAVFAEEIKSFDTEIKVNADASVNITETIQYDFGNLEKHGIYRDIPVKYKTSFGNQSVSLEEISVTDENDKPYNFSSYAKGKNWEIKIGDADKTITGVHTYVIKYSVKRAIGYFKDFDEIYWNATGNEWQVPILEATAKVVLPEPLPRDSLKSSCYRGAFGSSESCYLNTLLDDSRENVPQVGFWENSVLNAGEGLTVAVGFPKGIVYEPTASEKFLTFVKDNWILVLPIFVFIGMFLIWRKYGDDPEGTGVIIPEYDAPEGLTPLEIGAIVNQKIQNKDLSAEIIYLATKGYIKIEKTEEQGFIFKKEDYILKRVKDWLDLPKEADRKFMACLFDETPTRHLEEVRLKDLKENFYSHISEITMPAYESLVAEGFYKSNPSKALIAYVVIGMLFIFFAAFILGGVFGGAGVLSGIISGIIIMIFGAFMPAKTEKGVKTKEQILGLKNYLQIAEKDRLNFHNAPEKKPEIFEKLLPFAMVLGVEKAWAKEFADIYTTPPSWYSDVHGGNFNAVIFANNLHSFSNTAMSALSSAPGGHSGSGGGGFSGGGGGGGGGGSW